jgi:pyruvate dehydrogenase E2 component (dihydrolipoamide acetyltransferase)
MADVVVLRGRLKGAGGPGCPSPSLNDFVVKACALALREHPRANGAYRDGEFHLHSRVNVGIAVAAVDSLLVPTIFDADGKGLGQIAADTRMLAEKARAGSITPPELAGGTFTVSNLGSFGVSAFTAVINAPQAAILAVGEVADRAVVRGGEVVARPMMSATLSCDHRILYGADAAAFLRRIRELLEAPMSLVL